MSLRLPCALCGTVWTSNEDVVIVNVSKYTPRPLIKPQYVFLSARNTPFSLRETERMTELLGAERWTQLDICRDGKICQGLFIISQPKGIES